MTERFKGFTVVLEEDIREDDAQQTLNALRCIRGVLSVEPLVRDSTDFVARQRAQSEIREMVYGALREVFK
jgi:hypothetical protein